MTSLKISVSCSSFSGLFFLVCFAHHLW